MKVPLVIASALSCLTALTWSTPNLTATPQSEKGGGDLNGTYLCEGLRPDGTPYKGTVSIARHNGAYELMWSVGRDEQYRGIGILNGDVLAVSYFGGSPGVVAYKVERTEKQARLIGQWTVPNADGHVFAETLTRLTTEVRALPPLPTPERGRQRLKLSAGLRPA